MNLERLALTLFCALLAAVALGVEAHTAAGTCIEAHAAHVEATTARMTRLEAHTAHTWRSGAAFGAHKTPVLACTAIKALAAGSGPQKSRTARHTALAARSAARTATLEPDSAGLSALTAAEAAAIGGLESDACADARHLDRRGRTAWPHADYSRIRKGGASSNAGRSALDFAGLAHLQYGGLWAGALAPESCGDALRGVVGAEQAGAGDAVWRSGLPGGTAIADRLGIPAGTGRGTACMRLVAADPTSAPGILATFRRWDRDSRRPVWAKHERGLTMLFVNLAQAEQIVHAPGDLDDASAALHEALDLLFKAGGECKTERRGGTPGDLLWRTDADTADRQAFDRECGDLLDRLVNVYEVAFETAEDARAAFTAEVKRFCGDADDAPGIAWCAAINTWPRLQPHLAGLDAMRAVPLPDLSAPVDADAEHATQEAQ